MRKSQIHEYIPISISLRLIQILILFVVLFFHTNKTFAQNEKNINIYKEFESKKISDLKVDLFSSIENSKRGNSIIKNNIELKIRNYYGHIYYREIISKNLDPVIISKIASQISRYENITDKLIVQKSYSELKNMKGAYLTILYLNRGDYQKLIKLYDSQGIDIRILDIESYPCKVEKFSHGTNFIKETMAIIVESDNNKLVENCIGNVFFYAFYPGELLGLMETGRKSAFMGPQDLFNLRTIYDDRMPFKMENAKDNNMVDLIVTDAKSWVIKCYESNKCN